MKKRKKPLTPQQVKDQMRLRGITVKAFCRDKGINERAAYEVLNGRVKGYRGASHEAAVALGIKIPD